MVAKSWLSAITARVATLDKRRAAYNFGVLAITLLVVLAPAIGIVSISEPARAVEQPESSAPFETSAASTASLATENAVYVGGEAINPQDRNTDLSNDWSFSSSDVRRAATNGEKVAFGTWDQSDDVHFSDTSGNKEWTYTGHSGSVYGVSVGPNNHVLTASQDDTAKKLNPSDGSVEWSSNVITYSGRSSDISPDGNFYIGTGNNNGGGYVYRLDATDGTEVWGNRVASDDSTFRVWQVEAPGNGRVYAIDHSGTIHALDASDGSTIWTHEGSGTGSDLTVTKNHIWAVTHTNLYKIDRGTGGSVETSISTSNEGHSIAAGPNGNIYYGDNMGNVVKYDKSLSQLASTSVGSSTVYGLAGDYTKKYAVSGTVYYPDGDAVGNAEITAKQSGSVVATTTTDSAGSYSLNLADGDYTIVANKSGYKNGSTSVTVSGSAISGADITLGGNELSGTVRDENGDPVANATVKITAWDRDNYTGTTSEVTDKIEANRAELENAKGGPTAWKDQGGVDLELKGDGGHFKKQAEYVAVHTADDWDLSGYQATNDANVWSTDLVDLTNARVRVPKGEPVVLSLWDVSKNGRFQDSADEDLPGRTTEGQITVEQISPGGNVISDSTYATRDLVEIVDIPANGGSKRHEAFVLDLSPGFYRVYPKGEPGAAYMIVVGSPDQIIQPYLEDLRDKQDQLTSRAQEMQELKNDDKIITKTIPADSSGRFNTTLRTYYDEVTLVAYKAPPGLDGANVTRTEIIQYYDSLVLEDDGSLKATIDLDPNQTTSVWDRYGVPGAYYTPAGATDAKMPASGLTVDVEEVAAPTLSKPNSTLNRSELIQDLLDRFNLSDVQQTTQQIIEKMPTEELRTQYAELIGLVKKYAPIKDEYLEISGREAVPAPSSLSRSELNTEIAYANQALYSVDLTGSVEEPTVEPSNDSVSVAWNLPQQLGESISDANVTVFAHWSNGTTRVVNESYISVDSSLATDDVVRVNEYPIGDKDPAAVQFELIVAGQNEYRQRKDVVKNPAFSGDLPELSSIRLSSVAPGPDENVTVTFNPAESGSYKSLQSVTVYAPDGTTLPSSAPSGNSIAFTTEGPGVYTIKATIETTGGETITVPVRFKATAEGVARPPTIAVRSSTVGKYALVGGPIQDAEIRSQGAGETITVLAQIKEGADAPNQLDVHLEEMAVPGTATTSVRVVEGSSQKHVSAQIPVRVHYRGTGSDYQVRAHGQPITESGNMYGQVEPRPGGLTVKTYTGEDGQVTIKKVNNPSIRQEVWFTLDLWAMGVPGLGFLAVSPGLGLGASAALLVVAPFGVLAGRRRWDL